MANQTSASAELEQLLASLSSPDTATLKAGTAKVQKFLKENNNAGTLMLQQLCQSEKQEVRQMAGVLLRKEMDGGLWKKLDPQAKKQWSQLLLGRLVNEPVTPVRQAVAMLVKSVCKQSPEWPQLFSTIERMITGTNLGLRKTAVKLMRACIGTQACLNQWRTFFKIFVQVLQDSKNADLDTLVEAMKGVAAGAAFLDCGDDDSAEYKMLPMICPRMLEVLKACVKNGDSMAMGNVIGTLNDMMMMTSVDSFGKNLIDMAQVMIQIAQSEGEIEPEMRAKALCFIGLLCQRKMKLVQTAKLVDKIFEICVKAILEPMDENEEQEEEDTLHGTAADVLDAVFLGVPRYIFKHALGIIGQLGQPSADVNKRYAGILMLMLMLEGCSELIRADPGVLKQVVEYCVNALTHPEPRVRAVACQCVVQMATHLEPEALQYSKPILQALVAMNQQKFAKPHKEAVTTMAWDAMDSWIQELGPGAKDVLQDLMNLLSSTMNGQLSDNVKHHVLQVLGTLAMAVGPAFGQYYEPVVKMLADFAGPGALQGRDPKKDEDWIEVVGAAWVTLGHVMNAVGLEGNQRQASLRITEEVLKAMMLEHAPLAHGFQFCSATIALYKESLKQLPFFNPILQLLYKALEEDDGVEIIEDDEGFGGGLPEGFGLEENKAIQFDSLEDFANIGPNCKMQIKAAVLEKCIAALQCVGELCKNVPLGHDELEGLYQRSMLFFDYPHSMVRLTVIEVLAAVVHNVADQFPSEKPDDNAPGTVNKLNPEVVKYLNDITLILLATTEEDDDQDNVSIILDHFNNMMLKLGPGMLTFKHNDGDESNNTDQSTVLDRLLKILHAVLDGKLECQQDIADDPGGQDGEFEETHKSVVDSALGLLGTLSRLFGTRFEPEFRKFYPKLLKFCGSKRHNNFRSIAIGCLGDVMDWLAKDEKRTGSKASRQYLESSFKEALTMAALEGDEFLTMRQNAVFCAGCLFQAGGEDAINFYQPFVQAIGSALALPRGSPNKLHAFVRDNTVSALAKMTKALGSKLEQPVLREVARKVVDCLPLERDFIENIYVYPVLCELLKGNLLTGPHLDKSKRLLRAIAGLPGADTLPSDHTVDEPTKAIVSAFIQQC